MRGGWVILKANRKAAEEENEDENKEEKKNEEKPSFRRLSWWESRDLPAPPPISYLNTRDFCRRTALPRSTKD